MYRAAALVAAATTAAAPAAKVVLAGDFACAPAGPLSQQPEQQLAVKTQLEGHTDLPVIGLHAETFWVAFHVGESTLEGGSPKTQE